MVAKDKVHSYGTRGSTGWNQSAGLSFRGWNKRTCAVREAMSAKGQKRTLGLFDEDKFSNQSAATGLAENRSPIAPIDEHNSFAKKTALNQPRPHI